MQNGVHAFSIVEKSPDARKSKSFVDLYKFMRYSSPNRDISSFKRSFHCIMRADRSARDFQRRNKPRDKQIAIVRRFCPNLCVISLPIEIFCRLNAILTALCVQDVVHDYSATSKQAHTHANHNRSSILTITMRYFSPV